jgi:hypothetical protein
MIGASMPLAFGAQKAERVAKASAEQFNRK